MSLSYLVRCHEFAWPLCAISPKADSPTLQQWLVADNFIRFDPEIEVALRIVGQSNYHVIY